MRALRARYLRQGRNRYAAFQAVDICRKRQSIFAQVRAKADLKYFIYIMCIRNFQLSIIDFQL